MPSLHFLCFFPSLQLPSFTSFLPIVPPSFLPSFIAVAGYDLPDDGIHFVFLMSIGILFVGVSTLFAAQTEDGDFQVVNSQRHRPSHVHKCVHMRARIHVK
jgi:hypothetical protein